ncbi:4-carboxy-4-hydroxy-2-oxoadipate aldolase [Paraburkholderia aspalathi]|uniref:RraA family protein n=1 Tax=Paraburkholderia aspalathi TaxID=1324617 RepID=UPI001B279E97|nr:RraA family protein [Paraburkholderia aspalathi]CAE6867675.1 4-carboxy-4-hydroxy-2-oxoadipate aldolase [Paraburkholderia aspalathi]
MFVINDMPRQLDVELIQMLSAVETATVGHVRHGGFVDRGIRAVLDERRVAGTAVTLRIPGPDSALLHYVVPHLREGDFLVVDRCGDTRHACWGGVLANVARAKKLAGVVVDGPATDFGEIRKCGVPVWCRGPSPITTKVLGLEGAFNVPISVGGVVVVPGDAVLGDESGVLVLSAPEAMRVGQQAIGLQDAEIVMLKRLADGERLPDITGATEVIESRLRQQA